MTYHITRITNHSAILRVEGVTEGVEIEAPRHGRPSPLDPGTYVLKFAATIDVAHIAGRVLVAARNASQRTNVGPVRIDILDARKTADPAERGDWK